MKKFAIATAATAGFAAAVVGLAGPAAAAPNTGGAVETINSLEDQGYRVIVNRLSDVPLSAASVVSMQPGADIRSTVHGDDSSSQQVITSKVYYVDVR
ncbi:hypothetical protein [Mycolicibacterium sp.]|uniref:hypothetical protein n=1 Tax=Mycolicibacterium sp. TaxID=2320850 RepID=UPI003D0BCCA9